MKKALITGVSSGLGRFLYERIGGMGLTRNNWSKIASGSYDTIIHCAFNTSRIINTEKFADYVDDSILLTRKLLDLPHKQFILISSIDVYPKDKHFWKEDHEIDINTVHGIYAFTKLQCEAITRKHASTYVILRPSAMLGKYSRPNSLLKIIKKKSCNLTLSENSEFNYILHEDVERLIRYTMKNMVTGIYNVAATENIRLGEAWKAVSKHIGDRQVTFGSYEYNCGQIDVDKMYKTFGFPRKTSRQIIDEFIRMHFSRRPSASQPWNSK